MRIINIGSLNLDYVYRVDQFPQPGETKACLNLHINAGGKGLNQSVALAKAGSTVYHAGICGQGGDFLLQTLISSNVNTRLIINQPEMQNGHAIIEVTNSGENRILLYGGTNRCFTEDYIKKVIQFCTPDDLIVLQNEINNIPFIIKTAADNNIPVAMNVSPVGPEIKSYPLEMLRWIIVNEIEAKALVGGENYVSLMDNLCTAYPNSGIVMTLGGDGVWMHDEKTFIQMSAIPVDHIVDTTAAGDTFLGYFLSNISTGEKAEIALQKATCASALAIQKHGAAQSIPEKRELLSYWQKQKSVFDKHKPDVLSLGI